ncbi:hypothetical protein AOC05_18015 [Arthrobacter alpinus]|uniref:Lipoprotein n=1 Tax=Arthrobacter alpinus TaxID=656366 RepID=A0A0M4QQ21_9MICC|nr:hypothetical protein AOC05_18015 [Arthrobacter alpinus]
MKLPKLSLCTVLLLLAAIFLGGCSQSTQMSLEDSCREYIALDTTGPKSDLVRVSEDIRAAAPAWHSAVAKPALEYQDIMDWVRSDGRSADDDQTSAKFDASLEASRRLADLCGNQFTPKY